MRSSRPLQVLLAAVVAVFACAQLFPATSSSFTDTTVSSANTVTAKADWMAPTVSATVVQKTKGGTTGRIAPGHTFYVYANASDSGNPASGISSVTASVGSIATVSSAALSAGSWTVGGVSYGRRSAQLTAKSTLTTGSYSYSISATDAAGNGTGSASGSVSVNATAFEASDFTWDDSGATTGRFEPGETVRYVYKRDIDPESIAAGWDGSARTVRFVLADKTPAGTTQDAVGLMDNDTSALLPVGTTLLGATPDFAASGAIVYFTGSTMTLSDNVISVTLGTWTSATNSKTVTSHGAFTWTPDTTAWDTYGTNIAATAATSFAPTQFTATNKTGGTTGLAETGDTIRFTFNKAPAANSILSGWNGSGTPVTVRLADKGTNTAYANDYVLVETAAGDMLPLGPVELVSGDFAAGGVTVLFNTSTMSLSGSTVTIVLGSSTGSAKRDSNSGRKPTWRPESSILNAFDANLMAISITPVTGAVQF